MEALKSVLKIAIVGDFDRNKHSHWATEAALFHAAARAGISVEPHWIGTQLLEHDATRLGAFDAIWGAPGSPFVSGRGMLRAIEYARTAGIPYLGTCAGFQYALIEFSRNVLGIADADAAENASGSQNIVITPVACELPERRGALQGQGVALPVRGSMLERLCGPDDLRAEYFCSLEVNPTFVPRWVAQGLRVAAVGAKGELRAFELEARFFLATLFQPQLSSSFERPHPIVLGFVQAAR